jgi:4-hydroxy-tetrahydrodipicolinate synthase
LNTNPVAMPFVGIWPALLTPLKADLSIDHRRFCAHVLRLVEAGCGGVTPFGTTGEGPSFTVDERRAAVDALVAAGVPAERILVSTSAAALPDVEALTRHALATGAHGCLMLPPFYLKGVPDEGVIDAYRYLIDRIADERLRLYLYHIPQVAAVGLSHHVIATLKRLYPHTIVGIKDSQCDRAHSVALADAFMRDVRVYVGFEPDLPELARRGSTGAVSGLANFMPRVVHALVAEHASAATAARVARVRDLLARLEPYALIPALKGIMALLDDDTGWLRVRPPLVALEPGALAELRQSIGVVGIDRAQD